MSLTADAETPTPGGLLAWILNPLPTETFFAEVWGKRHWHATHDRADRFDTALPGLSSVDELLEQVRYQPSAVRSVRDGCHRPPDTYRRSDGELDHAAARADYADGYTILVDQLERFVRPVADVSHGLEVELNFPVQVNAYATPPGAAGFLPHYDHHDVLVLQLHGTKTWYLHGDTAVSPHEMQRRQESVTNVPPPLSDAPATLELTAGDAFYLPRGRVHAAQATATPSVHLTIGLHVPTMMTLITHTLHRLSLSGDRIHARLPLRHLTDADVRARLPELLEEFLSSVHDPAAVDDGVDALEGLVLRRGQCPPVVDPAAIAGLDMQTRIARRQPLYARLVRTPDGVALDFAQLTVRAAAQCEDALRFVLDSSAPFQISDLPGLAPPQRLELARTLLTSGLVFRSDDAPPRPSPGLV